MGQAGATRLWVKGMVHPGQTSVHRYYHPHYLFDEDERIDI